MIFKSSTFVSYYGWKFTYRPRKTGNHKDKSSFGSFANIRHSHKKTSSSLKSVNKRGNYVFLYKRKKCRF